MAASSSLYLCLYLPSSASQERIHEAYEQAVLFWSGQPDGSAYLKTVNFAYNILSDPMTRAAYDTYGLSSILEDECSYRESTPLSTPQPTPLSTHAQATIPTAKHPVPRVTFQLSEEQERNKERHEMRRVFEPEEDRRRKRDSSSMSKKKDKTEKGRHGDKANEDHKSSSKSRQDMKDSGSKSTSKEKEKPSSKDERSKDASRGGGSKERDHRKLKSTNPPSRSYLHEPVF